MVLKTMSRLSRAGIKKLSICVVLALAACTTGPTLLSVGAEALESATRYSLGRLDRLWATPAESLVMVQRKVAGENEQMIGLANDTTLAGDNYLFLIARVPDGLSVGRFSPARIVERMGGAITPFKSVSDNSLRSAKDEVGTYFWLEYRAGGSTNCVLAFRRLEGGNRVLPRGTNAMEALLRNCVVGSIEEALGPITASQISTGALVNSTVSNTGNRMMSPLAAPLQ